MIDHMDLDNFSGLVESMSDVKVFLAGGGVPAWVVMNQGEGCSRFSDRRNHDLPGVNNAGIQTSFRYSQVFNEL